MTVNFITRHPRVTLAITIIAVILGVYSLFVVRVEEYPSLSAPSFLVEVQSSAADAEMADAAVAKDIYEAVCALPGVRRCSSVCTEDGMCRTVVAFALGEECGLCEARLRDALREVRGAKVSRKVEEYMLVCAWTAHDGVPAGIPDRRLVSRIQAIDGVSAVDIVGRSSRRATIKLSPVKMAALGLSRAQVDSSIRSMGVFTGGMNGTSDIAIRIDGGLKSVEDLAGCVVRFDPQTLGRVRLCDIADISMTESPDKIVLVDGEKAVLMKVSAKPGCDVAATANVVRRVVGEHVAALADGVRFKVCSDFEERAMSFLRRMLWMPITSFVLVTVVLLLLWRSWRMAAIPMLTMTVAVLSAFAVGAFMGWSFNALTVFGLILVSGSLVDSSLLVVDMALDARVGGEKNVRKAAGTALARAFKPVVGGTAVSVIAYLPLLFARDVGIGIYLQFACMACLALVFSAVFAVTLTPVLFAAWCQPSVEIMERRKPNVLINFWRRFFVKASCFLVDHSRLAFFALIVLTSALIWSVCISPPPRMPMKGVRGMEMELEMAQTASPEEVMNMADMTSKRLLGMGDDVESIVAIMGEGVLKLRGKNLFRIDIAFRSVLGEAEAEDFARKARIVLSGLMPSASVRSFVPNATDAGRQYCGLDFYLSVQGNDYAGLADESRVVLERLRNSPLVEEVACGAVEGMSYATLALDKPASEAFGVSPKSVQEALALRLTPRRIDGTGLRGAEGGVFVVEDSGDGNVAARLSELSVPASGGAQIPLLSLGTLAIKECPRQVARFNGAPGVRFVVRTRDGVYGQDARRRLLEVIAPHGPFVVEWCENDEEVGLTSVIKGDWKVIVLSLAFLFCLMVAIYESWRTPLTAAGCAVMADLAAIWAMRVSGSDIDIYSVIALMAVSGFAVKSSMIVVDASRRAAGGVKNGLEAAKTGARRMFDLSQMIAWTSIAGVVPLVIQVGVVGGCARALGIAAITGLLVIVLVGLMFVPAWYAAANAHRDLGGNERLK